jgi:hypothetical protein
VEAIRLNLEQCISAATYLRNMIGVAGAEAVTRVNRVTSLGFAARPVGRPSLSLRQKLTIAPQSLTSAREVGAGSCQSCQRSARAGARMGGDGPSVVAAAEADRFERDGEFGG